MEGARVSSELSGISSDKGFGGAGVFASEQDDLAMAFGQRRKSLANALEIEPIGFVCHGPCR
jgi:hypothetical protein